MYIDFIYLIIISMLKVLNSLTLWTALVLSSWCTPNPETNSGYVTVIDSTMSGDKKKSYAHNRQEWDSAMHQ